MSVRIKPSSALAALKNRGSLSNGRAKSRIKVVEEAPDGLVSAEDDFLEDDEEEEEDEGYESAEYEEDEDDEEDDDTIDLDEGDDDDSEEEDCDEDDEPVAVDRVLVVVEPIISLVELIAKHKDQIVAALRQSAR